jgi:hypothetical protein
MTTVTKNTILKEAINGKIKIILASQKTPTLATTRKMKETSKMARAIPKVMVKTGMVKKTASRMKKDMTARVKGSQAADQTRKVAQATAAILKLAHIQAATRRVETKG